VIISLEIFLIQAQN